MNGIKLYFCTNKVIPKELVAENLVYLQQQYLKVMSLRNSKKSSKDGIQDLKYASTVRPTSLEIITMEAQLSKSHS